jgi:hypothetical protein
MCQKQILPIDSASDLQMKQLHVLFQLHTGMAADKGLFHMQLAAAQILFMLQHTSEDNIQSICSSHFPISPIFFSN